MAELKEGTMNRWARGHRVFTTDVVEWVREPGPTTTIVGWWLDEDNFVLGRTVGDLIEGAIMRRDGEWFWCADLTVPLVEDGLDPLLQVAEAMNGYVDAFRQDFPELVTRV